MITVVHIFHALPEKYASAFMTFAAAELPGYRHTFIGLRESSDVSHASAETMTIAPRGWLARYYFFREHLYGAGSTVWIFHGLFYGSETLSLWLALFFRTDLAYRSVWIVWGGDLYEFQQRTRALAAKVRRVLHRAVAGRFRYVAAVTPGDLDVVHVRLNHRAIKLPSLYINPLPFTSVVPPPMPSRTVVLLGNSADPTNEHLWALDRLAAMDSGFEIVCPLSYSGSPEYVRQVIEKGTQLFGDRFVALTDLLSADDYAKVIAEVSFAIFCHNRQQALGNVLSLIYDGKRVYMREDTTGFRFFADLGLDVQPLDSLTADALLKPVRPSLENVAGQRLIVREHFGHERARSIWKQLIGRIASQAPKHE